MNTTEMLAGMAAGELGKADLKAIVRNRGFDTGSQMSGELFRHVFLSDCGVAAALARLTETELMLLRLLAYLDEDVGVDFFQRLYPELVTSKYGSYTEQYKALFQKVKDRLICSGLLVFGTLPDDYSHTTILERRRFRFPREFATFLPALPRTRQLPPETVGQHRPEVLRDVMLGILKLKGESDQSGDWQLKSGDLLWQAKPFSAQSLLAWPLAQWQAAVKVKEKWEAEAFHPVLVARHILQGLRANDWLAANEMLPWWKLTQPTGKLPEPYSVFELGYQWGCLERTKQEETWYYRLAKRPEAGAEAKPNEYLDTSNAAAVGVNLRQIAPEDLERISQVSRMRVERGILLATPDLVKIGNATTETVASPLVVWLRDNQPAFRDTFQTYQQRKGRLLVHENLLVARVTDLSLKVMLEKKYAKPGPLKTLSKEYLAFPVSLLPEVQAFVKKSGHVIKAINAPASTP